MKEKEGKGSDSRGRVMIADDNHAILDSTGKLLGKLGYDVETAFDGHALLEAKEDLPSVLLLDVRMSGMDGKDICRELKQDEATKHISIILFSASKDLESSAKEAGADDFIEKPFDLEELTEKLDKYLAR